jgi:endonuclease/exonuclease/phosphatase family metal-dependent hydrolase
MLSANNRHLIFSSLTLFLGLQAFRVFLPEVIWYLGEDLTPVQLAVIALGVFALTLFFPLLRRWLGERNTLLLTVPGSVLVFVGYYFAHTALVYLVLSMLGILFWEWFLLFLLTWPRFVQPFGKSVPLLAIALPQAFLYDAFLRFLLDGYDLAWQHHIVYLFLTLLVGGVVVWNLIAAMKELPSKDALQSATWSNVLPLLGLGAFLYLAMSLVFNPAVLAIASGWQDRTASLLTVVFAGLGVLLCLGVSGAPENLHRRVAFLSGVILFVGVGLFLWDFGQASFLGTLGIFLAVVTLPVCLGWILLCVSIPATRPNLWIMSIALFLALLFMLVTLFIIAQFEFYWMIYLAGILAGLAAVWAENRLTVSRSLLLSPQLLEGDKGMVWLMVIGSVGLTLLLAISSFPDRGLKPGLQDFQVEHSMRVMTYNIHQGINADLVVDLKAIGDAIAVENPDIVVLNEVNRARATNGFMDVLPYLSKELDLPYVFGSNYADGQYGNALLSRYPLVSWDNHHYQARNPEVRGVLQVVVQVPGGPLTFYATHLDHIESPDNVRLEQVQELLALWAGNPRSVILGDLNATPNTPELAPIYQAGFVDLLRAADLDNIFTFWDPVPTPGRRIDFIFITPDLSFGKVWVPQTRASDHLPVVAEIEP